MDTAIFDVVYSTHYNTRSRGNPPPAAKPINTHPLPLAPHTPPASWKPSHTLLPLVWYVYVARITTFALEATLHQLRNDGYSVFVVRGKELPPPASEPGEGARDCWYRVKDLLEASRGGGTRATVGDG